MTEQNIRTMEIEQSVLGCMLLDSEGTEPYIKKLSPHDFSSQLHKELFEDISAIEESRDFVTVLNKCIERNSLVAEEYKTYLVQLCQLVPTISHIETYVMLLLEQSARRRLQEKVGRILLERNPDNMLEDLKRVVDEETEIKKGEVADIYFDQYQAFIKELYSPEEKRITTGFARLDKIIGKGLRSKTMSLIGAAPSTGKTALALQLGIANIPEKKVLFVSLEMSANQIYERIFSNLLAIPYTDIDNRELTDQQKEKMAVEMVRLQDSEKFIVLDSINTIEEIASSIAKYNPDFVVVDFIQIVRTNRKQDNRRGEVDYISSELKRLAKKYDCHIAVLSQITRNGKEAPRMSDLKESGGLEQDGDYIMLLHRPYVLDKSRYNPEETDLLFDKNKYGKTGRMELRFDGMYQRFYELDSTR